MSELKLTADSGGGTVSIKGPSTTGSNGNREFLLPDTYSGNGSLVTADSNGDISLADGNYLDFGNGGLKIRTNSNNAYITEATSGKLAIQGSNIELANSDGDETYIYCADDGAVDLYYDGSKKFETTGDGAKLTSGSHLDFHDSSYIRMGDGSDLKFYSDGSNGILEGGGTGANAPILINANTVRLQTQSGGEKYIDCQENGAVEIYYNNDKKAHTYADGFQTKLFTPMADDTYNMGTSALRWVKLYAASGSIGTSDRNEKNTIVESDLGLSFINKLKPVSYKWNNTNNDTATHYGLIAQDIEEAIKSEGKTLEDFGAIEKPDNAPMGLGYSELISPLIKAVQELSAKVEALEAG